MYREVIEKALQKYVDEKGNENYFQSQIESIAYSITESHLHELREFLLKIEGELELILFTVEPEFRRTKFLEKIAHIENYMASKDFE